MNLLQLLKFAKEKGASDMHIGAGMPPGFRIDGKIIRVKANDLKPEDCRRLCYSVLQEEQIALFEKKKEMDFSFEVKGVARFRANYYFSKNSVTGAFRQISMTIPEFEDLGLTPHLKSLTKLSNGLVLVTGPTGSGKTTTIAALLNEINQHRQGHIVTLEDPMEFVHDHGTCMVSQREIGTDSHSYSAALKAVVRQDPDFCLIGELRDGESVETALQLAETGHLVFSTLHTNSGGQTISRLISLFASEDQDRIRQILSFTLRGVISQRLLPSQQKGRVLAYEFLLMNSGVRNLIRENKLHQLETMMQVGQEDTGMVTLNQNLFSLFQRGHITKDQAMEASSDPKYMASLFKKAGL